LSEDDYVDPRELAAEAMTNGRSAEAAAQLQAMLDAGRGGLLTRIALAGLYVVCRQTARAVEVAREAAQLAPDAIDAAIAFGGALHADANLTAALAEYQRAARMAPDRPEPQIAIAEMWAEIGEWDKAQETLDRAEAMGAGSRALRTKIDQGRALPRHGDSFVRHLFDQFSADYDARMLGRLGYSAPAILRDLAAMYWGPKPKPRATLDLGCGTGLSGKAFADAAKPLTGVDLSPKMLAHAKATVLYDALVEADIEAWLAAAAPVSFATVLAADVFVYLGDLEACFRGVSRVLQPSGEFLFTVERGEDADFAMGERRRWRHSEAYLRRLAAEHGFEPASLIAATLRHDAGQPVEGLACLFVKT
jgi:predicted TPR repeat methyltransferase